ncbi:LysM peptidoglycan-binding domain-containing protein [Peribacillus sp. SCS-155]|uniref:LysM peptidoglycan-binding domain-containing protein n=1 Tax=Peribacillus sedimenti TaxID=3115297 RepID=UPI00390659AE
MITKKAIAASVLATSLLFSGAAVSPAIPSVSAATQISKYQSELNTFATHYAKILHTLDGYTKKLEQAKTEQELAKIYDQYLTYFDRALEDDAVIAKLNPEIQGMDAYIYDSLVEMFNLEVDYVNGDLTDAQFEKAYNTMLKFVDAQDAKFKKAAAAYKAKHKVTFSRDMLYLLDQEPEAPASTATYTVKKGDNLYRISKKYNTTVAELKKLNNLKSDSLKVGQVLKVSAAAGTAVPSTYKVKKGDTLYSIAKKAKLSVSDLKKLNNLKSDRINIGQVLKLKK